MSQYYNVIESTLIVSEDDVPAINEWCLEELGDQYFIAEKPMDFIGPGLVQLTTSKQLYEHPFAGDQSYGFVDNTVVPFVKEYCKEGTSLIIENEEGYTERLRIDKSGFHHEAIDNYELFPYADKYLLMKAQYQELENDVFALGEAMGMPRNLVTRDEILQQAIKEYKAQRSPYENLGLELSDSDTRKLAKILAAIAIAAPNKLDLPEEYNSKEALIEYFERELNNNVYTTEKIYSWFRTITESDKAKPIESLLGIKDDFVREYWNKCFQQYYPDPDKLKSENELTERYWAMQTSDGEQHITRIQLDKDDIYFEEDPAYFGYAWFIDEKTYKNGEWIDTGGGYFSASPTIMGVYEEAILQGVFMNKGVGWLELTNPQSIVPITEAAWDKATDDNTPLTEFDLVHWSNPRAIEDGMVSEHMMYQVLPCKIPEHSDIENPEYYNYNVQILNQHPEHWDKDEFIDDFVYAGEGRFCKTYDEVNAYVEQKTNRVKEYRELNNRSSNPSFKPPAKTQNNPTTIDKDAAVVAAGAAISVAAVKDIARHIPIK